MSATAIQHSSDSITRSVPLLFHGTKTEIEGCVGMYYPRDIQSHSKHKIPNVESVVEHKQSMKERKVKEWLKSKSKRKSPEIPGPKESQRKFSFTNLKVKATKSFDSLVQAANSVLRRVKSKAKRSSRVEVPDPLEQKVLSKPFPKAAVKLTLDSKQEGAIRKEEIERLLLEEQEARSDYEKIHSWVVQLEQEQVTKINKEEITRRKIIEYHENIIHRLQNEINDLDKRIKTLKTQISNAETVGNTNLADKHKKELNEVTQRYEENRNGLNNATEILQKELRDHEQLVDKRKRLDNREIQQYFDAENVTQSALERKIIVRKALQEYENLMQQTNEEDKKVTQTSPPEAKSIEHHWHKQQVDFKIMSSSERKRIMKMSVIDMQSTDEVKQLHLETDIASVEGYKIGDKLMNMEYAVLRKAGSNLSGKEDHEYIVKIISYKDIDPELEFQFRKHGFRVLRYLKNHPFKRVSRIHEIIQVQNEKAFIFEQMFMLTLQEFVVRNGAMNEKQSKHILTSITEAVNYLHCIGVAHQNITPSRVFINKQQHIKLGLLELSKLCWNPKKEKIIMQKGNPKLRGTTYAPEISDQKIYDPMAVDVYSIGAVACYLFLRKYPYNPNIAFPYDYQLELMAKELKNVLSNLGLDFILQCLTKNPELRPKINKIVNHAWFSSTLE